jgi:hypothetical protein
MCVVDAVAYEFGRHPLGAGALEAFAGLGVDVVELPGEDIAEALQILSAMGATLVGRVDLLALVLAQRENGVFLTDDRRLRELAGVRDVEVHGTLWVLDRMVAHSFVRPEQALRALDTMVRMGCRFPREEVDRRRGLWKRGVAGEDGRNG